MKNFYDLNESGRARRLRRLVMQALEHYPIEVKRVRLITNSMNGVFRIEALDGEKYVLRVYVPQSQTENIIIAETSWLKQLAGWDGHSGEDQQSALGEAGGYSSSRSGKGMDWLLPHPVATRSGGDYCRIQAEGVPEERCCALFSWVPGATLQRRITVENLRRFGALAARLHLHANEFQPPANFLLRTRYDRVIPFEEPVVLFEPQFAYCLPPSRRAVFEEAQERVRQAIDRLKSCGEPMRLLHGDLHPDNVKVYHQRLGVLDFEDMMWGWPVQDIGTTMLYFYGDREYETYRKAFQEGYSRVAPWPEREAGEVDTFIIGRNLVLANFVLLDPTPEWKEKRERYFARVERRLRALMYGEGAFNSEEW